MNIQIDVPGPDGSTSRKTIEIEQFPALDGWDIQQRFVEFAASHDKEFRRAYTLEVLAFAYVEVSKGSKVRLTTSGIIANHVGTWQNVERVFEEILLYNGIDPKTHADRPVFWEKVGAEMASSFISEVTRILGPAINFAAKKGE
jgi:hypothetical protein